ncbi:MAG: hypothetical protein JO307_32730 [Bryobacterales bacterium]|nr:hypothetical protein [Bryobacterales bacterium]MBV9399015.1 hypothetical protein [Bryobacterales bacterium]
MKLKMLGVVAGGLLVSGVGAYAHHSFAGTYLEDAPPVTVEGTLKEFLLRNPHSFVQVEDPKLKDDKGNPVRWSIEWGAAGQLAQQGVGRESLKVGDHVVVVGSPGRNAEDHRLRMRSIKRPSDGWCYGCTQGQTFN